MQLNETAFYFGSKMNCQGSWYAELTNLCILVESTGYFSLYKYDIFIEKTLDLINSNSMFSVHIWCGGICVDMGLPVAWI